MTLDLRRIVKYPPECFVEALPVDLVEGDNRLANYINFDPYILSFQGVSFARVDKVSFSMDVDGFSDTVRKLDIGASRGLDEEEELRVPSHTSAVMRIYTPTAITAFQWRHRVAVFRKTTALKLILNLPLTDRDRELDDKYGLSRSLMIYPPKPWDITEGIEEIKDANISLTSSGTIFRLPVPKNRKVVLLDLSVVRPASSASAYIDVQRDGVDQTLHVDPYCMPSLDRRCPVRVVALESILVTLDVRTAGTYKVRLTYGLGRLTIPEKIKWNIDLSAEERRIAEEQDLFDKVEAGVV